VYAENGEVLNQSQLVAQLTAVITQSQEKCSTPIGILTSENRTIWSKAYNEIKEGLYLLIIYVLRSHYIYYTNSRKRASCRRMKAKFKTLYFADESNRKNLDILEKSLFVVCIDGESSVMEKNAKDYETSAVLKAMVGGDSKSNAANRWHEHIAQVNNNN
jgi:hypothetical protein